MRIDDDNLTEITQLIGYWKYWLSRADAPENIVLYDVAALMADIVMTPVWIDYYRGKHRDNDVRLLYDLVSDLAVPDYDYEDARWIQVRLLLKHLEDRYGSTDDLPWIFDDN